MHTSYYKYAFLQITESLHRQIIQAWNVWYIISATLLDNSTVPTWSQVTPWSNVWAARSHMHTFCDGRPYLRVIGTGDLTVHSKFGVSLTFGSGVIVCQGNTAMWKFYVLLDATPCCFSEATLGEFPHWEAPRPCCCMPHFFCCSCLDCCEVSLNVNQVSSSLNRQPYFSVDASNSFLGQQVA